ncbi:MAG: oligosaccharide repeat unit polymerase [Sphingobacteriaceae bacterium]|nr:MAG: oligosaccharide repeat unit polymerase [Sphingobacteriaceae bacterium]
MWNYLLTQGAFILGFFMYKPLHKKTIVSVYKPIKFEGEWLFLRCLFFSSSILYLTAQVISYKVIGIPLLLGNHVDIYSNTGGWGVLGKIIDVFKPISIFLLVYFIFENTTSLFFTLYKYFFLVVLVIFFAFSGSKSEFMLLGFILFCYLILNANKLSVYYNKIRSYELLLLSVGMVFVFFTIIFKHNKEPEEAGSLEIFLFRLVASGDVYYFAYPNNNIELLNHSKPFLALFGDVFSTLRIVPRTEQPVVLGFQLFNLFGVSDTVSGPNARHNVFGYVYYGFYGSIVFSFCIGLLLSFARNKLFYLLRRNLLGQVLFVLIYLQIAVVETDPQMVMSNLENVVLLLPILLLVSFSATIILKS